ncbi:MAG: hypothetical protein M1834_002868 [Cirrosporium novae-zelandiae]|nr:MAG: hypothetical protein M1834_002868 [Cirrosporium novae-zelandiae]
MQFSKIAILAVLATPFAAALSLSSLPTCALKAALVSIDDTGCSLVDTECICESTTWMSSLVTSVKAACTTAELEETIEFAEAYCLTAGVTLDISAIEASATANSKRAAKTPAAANAKVTPVGRFRRY